MSREDPNTSRQGLELAKCQKCGTELKVPRAANNHRNCGGRWQRAVYGEHGKIVDWR